MSTDATAILDRLERAELELHHAATAALKLARAMAESTAAARADDDEWTRMPAAKERCPISNWSRSTLNRLTAPSPLKPKVRRKTIGGSVFYSGRDVRALLNSPES
ncbi:MAG: hypothetical protein JWO82_2405 [Akkermansiaceae bacterium]|nr:hypothetical protein [Akkermansiaceae bacterium]